MHTDRSIGGFELLVIALAAAALVLGSIAWAGAALALLIQGHLEAPPPAAAIEAVADLAQRPGQPAAAWPTPAADLLPGPVVYWICTALVAGAVATTIALGYRRFAGPRVGSTRRKPLGVDARPDFAAPAELQTLVVKGPTPGRFILGRVRRRLVATEASPEHGKGKRRSRRDHRRGDRGAVAVVGPSRCGKTVAAVAGILEWEGPAVLSSVKADLLATTIGWRTSRGSVQVFDPMTSTGALRPTGSWSPIAQAVTTAGAQRAARALCDAAPRNTDDSDGDFWLTQAEILLSALLYIAHHRDLDMGHVARWVLEHDRPIGDDPGVVRKHLDALLTRPEAVQAGARDAERALKGIWKTEERTRSSVYATAQTVVWPWSDPKVAASSKGRSIDLQWLLSGDNTVYLCAPIEDQRRLAPAFGGLLNDLINQAYRYVATTGRPIDPPLLIVIDEAGNTPLRALPEYSSTLAGLGVLLVTIWQSVAQIESAYGKAADTILTNHLSKVFYAGLSDPSSLRYITTVLGEAEVETRTRSVTSGGGRSGSSQWSTSRHPLAPVHALRQMQPGDALLLHGTLPPAHLRTRPFYRERHLTARASAVSSTVRE